MHRMLFLLRKRGYKKVSLSVQKANYAVKMYEAVGFEVLHENEEEYIMVCDLEALREYMISPSFSSFWY